MGTLAIIILVLLGLYVIFGSMRQRKLLINKFVVIVGVVGIGILLLNGQFSKNDSAQTEIQYYQKLAPTIQEASYYLQTESRAYYVSTFQDSETSLVLTDYYYFDKKKWELSNVPLPLDKTIYGELKLYKRNIGG